MKKMVLLFFCVSVLYGYSQNNSHLEVGLSTGISSPSKGFEENAFASNGTFYEASTSYYFSNFGIGANFGQFTNELSNINSNQLNSFSFPTVDIQNDIKTGYFGIGPDFKTNLNKFNITVQSRVGFMTTKATALEKQYTSTNAEGDVSTSTPIYSYNIPKSNGSYFSTGIRFGYSVIENLSIYLTTNYLSSFSNSVEINESTAQFQDLNQDGIIDEEELLKLIGADLEYSRTTKTSSPQVLNFGAGIIYNIPSKTKVRKPMQDIKNENPTKENRGLLDFQKPEKIIIQKDNKPIAVSFTNPVKERKKQQRKIILLTPKNNTSFDEISAMPKFTWKTVGELIMQPKYGVTVEKVNANGREVLKTYFETTNKSTTNAKNIFKENPESGTYKWKVTELTTGTTSNYSFFNFTNCDIDFSITNEEIECLGYEGADRKFKICFDATYASPSGDLTYVDALSGLSVYDQTYASLSPTLVSPNPTLVTQIGATTSTVSYCFEVTVDNTVTSIGFGLQGDDLDPSPIVCQPGVSFNFDELPDCICDECEEIELSFDNFTISPNGTSGNQFNFNGNINVNVPIYGVEFQVQSYSYSASPSACTEGVSNVEDSGMILMPGTSINGSTSLQLANETVSGSVLSNNNATKNIKYTSNSPISGPVPVNLTIGLPGPISGLDPSCCTIEYIVCIKVLVFYEEGNCKSCVFTHCFEFNNQ